MLYQKSIKGYVETTWGAKPYPSKSCGKAITSPPYIKMLWTSSENAIGVNDSLICNDNRLSRWHQSVHHGLLSNGG